MTMLKPFTELKFHLSLMLSGLHIFTGLPHGLTSDLLDRSEFLLQTANKQLMEKGRGSQLFSKIIDFTLKHCSLTLTYESIHLRKEHLMF
jgi:hypothetical protein